jgi:hypothetical protein
VTVAESPSVVPAVPAKLGVVSVVVLPSAGLDSATIGGALSAVPAR